LAILHDCDCQQVPLTDMTNSFINAREAVEKTRETEAIRCLKTLDERIERAENNPYNNPEMQMHIDELKGCLNEFRQPKKKFFKLNLKKGLFKNKVQKQVDNIEEITLEKA